MGKKALVVDNDFFFVEFLTELLEKKGYEVAKAYDGKEGISRLEEGPYQFIFTDIVMPKIDGQQFIRYVRSVCPEKDVRIIAVSGILIEHREEIDQFNADGYLAKGPIEKMAHQVEVMLDKFELDSDLSEMSRNIMNAGDIYPNQTTVELIENLNFSSMILENIPIGVMVVDIDAKVILSNAMSLRILQMPVSQVLNRPVMDVLPLADKRRLVGALKHLIGKPNLTKVAFSVPINDSVFRLIISSFMIEGRIGGWIITMEG